MFCMTSHFNPGPRCASKLGCHKILLIHTRVELRFKVDIIKLSFGRRMWKQPFIVKIINHPAQRMSHTNEVPIAKTHFNGAALYKLSLILSFSSCSVCVCVAVLLRAHWKTLPIWSARRTQPGTASRPPWRWGRRLPPRSEEPSPVRAWHI